MTTGQRIKLTRKNAGMTQSELAKKLDIPYQSIGQWERDLRNPKIETLQAIATALGVRTESLLDETSYSAGFEEGSKLEEWQNNMIDDLWKQEGYSFSDIEAKLIHSFSQLNRAGQEKAVDSVKIIAGNPDYQKEKDPPQPE